MVQYRKMCSEHSSLVAMSALSNNQLAINQEPGLLVGVNGCFCAASAPYHSKQGVGLLPGVSACATRGVMTTWRIGIGRLWVCNVWNQIVSERVFGVFLLFSTGPPGYSGDCLGSSSACDTAGVWGRIWCPLPWGLCLSALWVSPVLVPVARRYGKVSK